VWNGFIWALDSDACEHDNEPLESIKSEELDYLRDISISKGTLLHEVSYGR
jgi:hypothetical protein